jgi:hypothetical protein
MPVFFFFSHPGIALARKTILIINTTYQKYNNNYQTCGFNHSWNTHYLPPPLIAGKTVTTPINILDDYQLSNPLSYFHFFTLDTARVK